MINGIDVQLSPILPSPVSYEASNLATREVEHIFSHWNHCVLVRLPGKPPYFMVSQEYYDRLAEYAKYAKKRQWLLV